jgi:F420-dependent oxidoreductase-like protein
MGLAGGGYVARMRFGAFVPQGWRFDLVGIDPGQHWATMRDLAQRFDANDAWTSIWVYDHFHTSPEPSDEATHEAWTLMAAFAADTSRIRLGQMCTCMAYRNPAYLAKVAATVDHVSGGRVEMGIGGGWYEHEWRAYGYGFPAARERLGRLREGVEIFRQAWTTGSATLDGEYYQVDGALVRPLPVQQGRSGSPIWIAGGGEKVTLKIAAMYADFTNFGSALEEFRHKSAVLEEHCRALGRDFGEITRSTNFNTFIGSTESEVEDRKAAFTDRFKKALGEQRGGEYAESVISGALAGTPEQVVERLSEFRDAGMTYYIGYFPELAYDTSGVELFEREVIPALA